MFQLNAVIPGEHNQVFGRNTSQVPINAVPPKWVIVRNMSGEATGSLAGLRLRRLKLRSYLIHAPDFPLQRILPHFHPRRIVLFCNFYAGMAQQFGHALNGDSALEQHRKEDIAEPD